MNRVFAHLNRIVAVARVECAHVLHDRVTMSLVALVPAVQLVLFGYAVNLDPKGVPVAIAREPIDTPDRLLRTLETDGYFSVRADGLAPGGAERMVAAGNALVGIEIPRIDVSDPDEIPRDPRIIVDATDPAAVRPALAMLEIAFWKRIAELSTIGALPVLDVAWLYNPKGLTAWTIVPGLVGVIVMVSMLMLGALTLVRERERGSWEALLASPVDSFDALVGKLSPYIVIGIGQAVLVICIARALYGLPVTGDLWALLAAAPLYAAAHLIFGFAISAIVETQMQAVQAAVFFYLPSMLLSGFMFPFQGMPHWARTIGEMLPITHFVRATRGVLLKGWGAPLVFHEMVPVAIFTVIVTSFALVAYRRRVD
ncbi:MAG: ABC transporter permease [Candidatus Binataceae bacterium]